MILKVLKAVFLAIVISTITVTAAFASSYMNAPLGGDGKPDYDGKFKAGKTVYIFGENVKVMSAPKNADDGESGKLGIGEAVKVVGIGPESTVNGYEQNWLKIEFEADGKKKTGYIWGGFAALAAKPLGERGVMALFGLTGFTEKEHFLGELRLASAGKLLSSAPFRPHAQANDVKALPYYYNAKLHVTDARKMNEFKKLIIVECRYNAYGYPGGNNYFGFDGRDVSFIASDEKSFTVEVLDSEKKVLFPADNGGAEGRVIITELIKEFDEAKKAFITTKDTKKTFKWFEGALVPAE